MDKDLSKEQKDELRVIAQQMLQGGKGIVAADESTGTWNNSNGI